MISDCHLHTEFSGDCETPVRDQIETAIGLGMKEMCVTDHHDFDSAFCGMDFTLDVLPYLAAIKALREEYKDKIRINIGIELGLMNHLNQYLHEFVKEYGSGFDFILGSSHFVAGMDPYDPAYWEQYGTEKGLEEYFKASLSRVRKLSGVFDSFGHLDYVVRYAPQPDTLYRYERYEKWIEPLLKELVDHGKGLECNMGGSRYGLGRPNPSRQVLMRYRELGGEIITVGSDAHRPEHLGYSFDGCRRLLLECGFRYYAVYRARKPVFIPL